MTNIFLYQDPHPAHKLLADVLKCEGIQNNRSSIAKVPSVGRLLQARHIQKELRKYSPEIIVAENVSTDLLAGAIYKSQFPQTKLIGIVADPKVYELKGAPLFDKALTYKALDAADLLMVGSDMMKDLIPSQFHHKVHKFYPPIFKLNEHLKKHATFNKNFVFVGRLDDYKGVDMLYNVFLKQKDIWNTSTLYVAGDGKYKSMFQGKHYDNIKYLGKTKDSLFMADIAAFYLAPARCEPSGVAIAEAMAQGIVPIVSRHVGYKELVEKIDSRLVVENIDDAINIINYLFNNKKVWQTMSTDAKKIASTLTTTNTLKMFNDALNQLNLT